MNLVILQEPLEELNLALRSGNLFNSGYLLGRRLGQSLIADRVYFVHWKKLLEPEFFLEVESSTGRSVLGVFETGKASTRKKMLLQPLFTEKIHLQLSLDRKGEIKARARMISFDGRFSFMPIERLIIETEEKP